MITMLLAGFAAVLAAGVPRVLARARWPYRAPRLGVLAWQATGVAALTATVAASSAALLHYRPTRSLLPGMRRLCLDALSGAHGRPGQAMAVTGLGMLTVMAVRLVAGTTRLAAVFRWRRRHRRLLGMIGIPRADLGATVLTHPDPVAYLLPGWPDRVVVTTGALTRLPEPELDAVLAHERAHAAGRHHRACAAAGVLHHAYPSIPIFAHAHRQITRLVELCADEAAARTQSRLALARALVTMAEAAATPAAVLHAGGGDAAERVIRLLQPPRPLSTGARLAVVLGFTGLPLVPLLLLALEPLAHLTAFAW